MTHAHRHTWLSLNGHFPFDITLFTLLLQTPETNIIIKIEKTSIKACSSWKSHKTLKQLSACCIA